MAQPALKRATYDDILAAPPNMVAEILSGVLYTSPRPAPRHSRAASALGVRVRLGGFASEFHQHGLFVADSLSLERETKILTQLD